MRDGRRAAQEKQRHQYDGKAHGMSSIGGASIGGRCRKPSLRLQSTATEGHTLPQKVHAPFDWERQTPADQFNEVACAFALEGRQPVLSPALLPHVSSPGLSVWRNRAAAPRPSCFE